MGRKWIGVAALALIALAVAGGTWAQQAGKNERARCSMTCTTLMNYQGKMYVKMLVHQGDVHCWKTCWSRFGNGKAGTTAQMKATWLQKKSRNMRANQCAQACWRRNHSDSLVVTVSGQRSTPRANVCMK